MSKYDWSGVPNDVQWIATDKDGVSNGFCDEPSPDGSGLWCVDENFTVIDLPQGFVDIFKGDWRDSLEERPK